MKKANSLKMMMVAVLLLFVNCEKPNKCQAEIDELNRLEKRKGEIVGEVRKLIPPAIVGIFEEMYWECFEARFVGLGYKGVDDSIKCHQYIFKDIIVHSLFPEDNKKHAQKIIDYADSNVVYIPLIEAAKLAKEACEKQ